MIICSNCGAANDEREGRICRKCGALLPIGNRPPRMRFSFNSTQQKQKEKNIEPNIENIPQEITHKPVNPTMSEINLFVPKKSQNDPNNDLDLQSIPVPGNIDENNISLQTHQRPQYNTIPKDNLAEIPMELNEIPKSELPEVEPPPFRSPIISNRHIRSPQLRSQNLQRIPGQIHNNKNVKPPQSIQHRQQIKVSETNKAENRKIINGNIQKRLEDEMSGILAELSRKIAPIKKEPASKKKQIKEVETEELPPSSMNEILNGLLVLDSKIQAAALIQNDGTILASAMANNITDGLFSTIARTLSIIGTDIVNGLNAGDLKSISIRGTEGLLNLAPIRFNLPYVKDIILIMFSEAKVRSGIINIAASFVKKKIKKYIGIKE
ncbi:MAG: hypothetical protein ACP6IY_08655 [Promethearchaeia archaeon]